MTTSKAGIIGGKLCLGMGQTKYINIDDISHNQIQTLIDGFFADYLKNYDDCLVLCSLSAKRGWRQEFHTMPFLATHRAADLYYDGCDTYFGVNPVKRLSRKATAIQYILRLHVDADFKDAKGLTQLLRLKPSAVIASGTKNRYHGYWNFQSPVNRKVYAEEVTQMNRQLTRVLGIKEEAFDLSRVLRIPGTFNFKDRRKPRPVEIVEWWPERKYTLEQCADLLEIKLDEHSGVEEKLIITPDQKLEGKRGQYLSKEERNYVEKLLNEGLFESESRNKAMMLLIRHYYGLDYSADSIKGHVTRFFEQRSNGFSKEWKDSPKLVKAKINCAIKNWFNKACPISLEIKPLKRLSRRDEAFIQNQDLKEGDKRFLRDAMTWIVNAKRGDNLILPVRQLIKFKNCNERNYKQKREILYGLGIIALAVEHERKTRLANEYKVLYQFGTPLATLRGRRRNSEIPVKDAIDRIILSGESNKTIREWFPSIPRQLVYNHRKRLDHMATQSREYVEM